LNDALRSGSLAINDSTKGVESIEHSNRLIESSIDMLDIPIPHPEIGLISKEKDPKFE
jgi:hypothetical protein